MRALCALVSFQVGCFGVFALTCVLCCALPPLARCARVRARGPPQPNRVESNSVWCFNKISTCSFRFIRAPLGSAKNNSIVWSALWLACGCSSGAERSLSLSNSGQFFTALLRALPGLGVERGRIPILFRCFPGLWFSSVWCLVARFA